MKKEIFYMFRTLLLILAMIAGGASSELHAMNYVSYVDNDGTVKTMNGVTELNRHNDFGNLAPGWYVVIDVNEVGTIDILVRAPEPNESGDLHIIIPNGVTMDITESGINITNDYGNVYFHAESNEDTPGTLTAKPFNAGYAISANCDITFNGLNVEAESTIYGSGISSDRNITVNSGSITAIGESFGIFCKGTFTMNGGTVDASSDEYGIIAEGGVVFNGGNLTANGTQYAGIDADVTLMWTSLNDSFTASSIEDGFTFTIDDGYAFSDGTNIYQSGRYDGCEFPNGKTLTPYIAASVTSLDGGGDVVTLYYENFYDAIDAAKSAYVAGNGSDVAEFIPTVTLHDDIDTGEDEYSIGNGSDAINVKIDLNGHDLSGNGEGCLFTVNNNAVLSVVDNSGEDEEKGTVSYNNEIAQAAIKVEIGGTLKTKSVSFACVLGEAISNAGTAEIDGGTLTGLTGIYCKGKATVSNATFNVTCFGIKSDGGDLTIGSGVSIVKDLNNAIYCDGGKLTFNAIPAITKEEGETEPDVIIEGETEIAYGADSFTAPLTPMTLRVKGSGGADVDPTYGPVKIFSGYAEHVKVGESVIDPNLLFAWYESNKGFSFGIDASGDVNVGKYAASFTAYYEGNILETMTFETFDEAFSFMPGYLGNYSGETSDLVLKLKLLSDVDLVDMPIDIFCGEKIFNMVLDLNGHTLSSTDEAFIIIHEGNSLTIEDSGNGGSIAYTGSCGINCEGTLTLKTLPNFEYGGNSEHADIMLQSEPIIHFGEGNFVEPSNPIIVGGNIPERVVFTDGYSDNVKSGEDIIDPAFVFRLQMPGSNFVGMMDDKGEEVIFMLAPPDDVFLFDGDDNIDEIRAGRYCNVFLGGRIMTKDGTWNTLCLPFDVDIDDSPLAGAEVKTLDANNSILDSNGDLNLTFVDANGYIEAGLPYIIKWTKPDNYVPYDPDLDNFDECDDLTDADLVFRDVIMMSPEPIPVMFSNALGDDCQFVGQYSPFFISDEIDIDNGDPNVGSINEILFFATGATAGTTVLGYSQNPRTLRSCRAHFYVPAIGGAAVRATILDFGDGEATAIRDLRIDGEISGTASTSGWYSIDGRKLSGEPKAKGVYIHNGKKMIIK